MLFFENSNTRGIKREKGLEWVSGKGGVFVVDVTRGVEAQDVSSYYKRKGFDTIAISSLQVVRI